MIFLVQTLQNSTWNFWFWHYKSLLKNPYQFAKCSKNLDVWISGKLTSVPFTDTICKVFRCIFNFFLDFQARPINFCLLFGYCCFSQTFTNFATEWLQKNSRSIMFEIFCYEYFSAKYCFYKFVALTSKTWLQENISQLEIRFLT